MKNSTDESAGSLSGKDEEKSNNDDESKDDSFRIVTSILFFHHHRLHVQDDNTENGVVHELLMSCSGHRMFYHQMSGNQGALIRIPSGVTSRKY
jgi:hypothetical protein